MRYVPTVNLWTLPLPTMVRCLTPGQWVSAGVPDATRSNCGRFYGVRPNGSVVVAWNGNARKADDYRTYQRTIHQYAKGGR